LWLFAELFGEAEKSLKDSTFQPDADPDYWRSIQALKDTILDIAKSVPDSDRLTGSDIATLIDQLVPGVNDNASLDIDTMRTSLLLNRVETATLQKANEMMNVYASHILDPFHQDRVDAFDRDIAVSRQGAEKALFERFSGYKNEESLWKKMEKKVYTVMNRIVTDIQQKVNDRKGKVCVPIFRVSDLLLVLISYFTWKFQRICSRCR
jgi:hypothetical protein